MPYLSHPIFLNHETSYPSIYIYIYPSTNTPKECERKKEKKPGRRNGIQTNKQTNKSKEIRDYCNCTKAREVKPSQAERERESKTIYLQQTHKSQPAHARTQTVRKKKKRKEKKSDDDDERKNDDDDVGPGPRLIPSNLAMNERGRGRQTGRSG
ncbi:hypothetical protein K504DRAFT_491061 [Pleomassaria siparia CBS 279.74]|uniref:Uncharacterized protein n=1 Tax=Pleomassaria siparia CBS 279.74 TaxID=1314801 RepID=A0A6G1KAY3_9PLEO|nr:hypothetical protein K504DRAFT_491061 [Pleomassaria siparia CBS 279.74]